MGRRRRHGARQSGRDLQGTPGQHRQVRRRPVKRSFMDRIIDTIEAIAALFVGLVAADIFISVVLRRFFSTQIPDAYDFGSMLLGILIFWGIAASSYLGGHIMVALVWAIVGTRGESIMEVFA